LLGCSPDGGGYDGGLDAPPLCGVGFLGDAGAPVELAVTELDPDASSRVIGDGSNVSLLFPPQGGRVIFAGVRAYNIDPCTVQLTGSLRDPTNGQVNIDGRTVNLVVAGDGRGTSNDTDISTFANITVCPNEWSATDVYGNPYDLTVSVTDHEGRSASKTVRVTPTCAEPARLAECLCLCKHGYILGSVCSDAGSSDTGTSDAGVGDGGVE